MWATYFCSDWAANHLTKTCALSSVARLTLQSEVLSMASAAKFDTKQSRSRFHSYRGPDGAASALYRAAVPSLAPNKGEGHGQFAHS